MRKPIQLPLPFEGETIKIRIRGDHMAIVDAVGADLCMVYWDAVQVKDRVYARMNKPKKRMHRIIMERVVGRELDRSEHVDHIDNNPLNNRRSNLRIATMSQNFHNSKRSTRNTTGYKGVSYKTRERCYVAQIRVEGKVIELGHFKDPKKAYEAYCEAARKYYGEFARLE